mmetsp:Transcript_4955/g.14023  ORF Transcript_4955/g.14023 Transcript_4955/m.14023 type:complete len:205 (-) Transcript_4955:720-1334(-)
MGTLRAAGVTWNSRVSRGAERALLVSVIIILGLVRLREPEGNLVRAPLRGSILPEELRRGSCVCGGDAFCMCTPSLAIDVVLEQSDGSVLLVRRRDNGKLAVMGGFVEVGESVEDACHREAMEEAKVELTGDLRLLEIFSEPGRDPRRHTVSVAYAARVTGEPHAGDDAQDVVSLTRAQLHTIAPEDFAFDHERIISAYLRSPP